MSKYGLNDESTGFKNGLYKIAVIVFMVVMLLKSCTDPDNNGSDISLMIVSLIFIMLLFFLVNRRESDLMGKNEMMRIFSAHFWNRENISVPWTGSSDTVSPLKVINRVTCLQEV